MKIPQDIRWLCLVALIMVGAATGYSSSASTSAPRPSSPSQTAASAKPATVMLGRTWTLSAGKRLDQPQLLCDDRGRLWAFGQTQLADKSWAIVCARFDGQTWTPFAESVTPTKFPNSPITAALDASDNPVVIWGDVSDKRGELALFFTRWTGREWTQREAIARVPSNVFPAPTACLDGQGRMHVVYRNNLDPPEGYSQGLLVVDGVWSPKYFHLSYDGRQWSEPQPTTERGRFGVGEPYLNLEADGRLCLVTEISDYPQLGSATKYLAFQTWDGKCWSKFQRLTPEGVSIFGGSMALDASGARHVTWWDRNLKSDYLRVTAEGKIEADPVCREMCKSVVKRNAFGWILCYSESQGYDRAQAWTGDRWTPPVEVPDMGEYMTKMLVAAPSGAIYVFRTSWGKMHIQEILLGGAKKP